jgi:2-dehydropantoate 2-reductase
MRDVFDEIVSVAHAEGVHLDADSVWHHLMSVFSAVGPHLTSMAVDVSLGRQTEIDSMSIEISRRGTRHGIKTPLNDSIGRLIMAIQEITMMQTAETRTHQK